MKYPVVGDNEWFHIPRKGIKHGCCDCSLIHDVDFKIDKDGKIWTRWRRNAKATSASRRQFHFEDK